MLHLSLSWCKKIIYSHVGGPLYLTNRLRCIRQLFKRITSVKQQFKQNFNRVKIFLAFVLDWQLGLLQIYTVCLLSDIMLDFQVHTNRGSFWSSLCWTRKTLEFDGIYVILLLDLQLSVLKWQRRCLISLKLYQLKCILWSFISIIVRIKSSYIITGGDNQSFVGYMHKQTIKLSVLFFFF